MSTWQDVLRDMTRARALERARSLVGQHTVYKLGRGGFKPQADLWSDGRTCDCSGFIAWVLGIPRELPPGSGHWLQTTTYWNGGEFPEAEPFPTRPLAQAMPGDLLVYPDSGGRQGHMGIVMTTDQDGPATVVHCSAGNFRQTGDAIQETSPRIFTTHARTRLLQVDFAQLRAAAGVSVLADDVGGLAEAVAAQEEEAVPFPIGGLRSLTLSADGSLRLVASGMLALEPTGERMGGITIVQDALRAVSAGATTDGVGGGSGEDREEEGEGDREEAREEEGVFGLRTARALMAFQRRASLEPTATLDAVTLRALDTALLGGLDAVDAVAPVAPMTPIARARAGSAAMSAPVNAAASAVASPVASAASSASSAASSVASSLASAAALAGASVAAAASPLPVITRADGDRFFARVGDSPEFFVGRRVRYLGKFGLMNLSRPGNAAYAARDFASAHGHWAHLLEPTAMCEGSGFYDRLNTYDRARFTFGFLQYAAHVPDNDFVKFFRRLLALPLAARYFPDLTLVNGRVARTANGGTELLETSDSTRKLMDYLNPGSEKVEEREVVNCAKLVHWCATDAAHRDAQVQIGIEEIHQALKRDHARYGLDGRTDITCLIIFDIHHQGRAKVTDVRAALQRATTEQSAWSELLDIGLPTYKARLSTLRAHIMTMVSAGVLGTRRYRAATGEFV